MNYHVRSESICWGKKLLNFSLETALNDTEVQMISRCQSKSIERERDAKNLDAMMIECVLKKISNAKSSRWKWHHSEWILMPKQSIIAAKIVKFFKSQDVMVAKTQIAYTCCKIYGLGDFSLNQPQNVWIESNETQWEIFNLFSIENSHFKSFPLGLNFYCILLTAAAENWLKANFV